MAGAPAQPAEPGTPFPMALHALGQCCPNTKPQAAEAMHGSARQSQRMVLVFDMASATCSHKNFKRLKVRKAQEQLAAVITCLPCILQTVVELFPCDCIYSLRGAVFCHNWAGLASNQTFINYCFFFHSLCTRWLPSTQKFTCTVMFGGSVRLSLLVCCTLQGCYFILIVGHRL